jgi:diguanylate cyclase (GGDEF)-like protein/PAS domain S-box-containing protein
VEERTRRLERSALSLGGLLTASFGAVVLLGEGRRLPIVRDVHEAWPTITPGIAVWLVFAGLALIALSRGVETLGARSRTLRLRLPSHALGVAAAAAATGLATSVAVHQAGRGPSLGLALATLLVGGLLTILIGVLGMQSARRERERRTERDRAESACSAAETRSVHDVEERMRAQAALTEAEAHFRSAFEEAPIGMALITSDMRFLRVNRALSALTGYPRDQLEGLPVASITHPGDLKADREASGAMLEGELSSYSGERRYMHAAGSPVWVLINSTLVRDASGDPMHFLTQMQDITERRRHEAALRHMADHDPLTGLLNRRSFERELERHVTRVERYGARGAAIVLDLDHFKTINDTLGHSAGDQLIVRVAHTLRTRLRQSDVLARLGGDEFAILLPEASPEEAELVAGAVLEAVRTQTVSTATGRTRAVTASLGVALLSDVRRLTGEELLVNADLAMYDAKESGRNRVAAYATAGHPDVQLQARMSWADLIRDALAEDRFVLHAQPIVDLATGLATQHELLLRMRAADGELIGPSDFLPVAERFDLMPAIDRWVAANAIRMVGAERRRGRELTVEVNISGGSTGDPELLALIERELRAADVDPAQIIFEITETIAVSNIPRAQHFAGRLAELGCRFALDDFGAGFGSFYYLKHLPFDYLKIDGEFVRHSAVDKTDQLVIQAVVDIARGLGKHTIAEHVGDAETAALLRRMGVEYAQGFHLGAPAPLEDCLSDVRAAALPSS